MAFGYTTELDMLRAQLADAHAELMRRDREKVHADVAAIETKRKEEEATAAAAQSEANSKELERCRANAWMNHRVDVAIAQGNDAFVSLLSDTKTLNETPEGWPPGTKPEDFVALAQAEIQVAPDARETQLGRLLFGSSGPLMSAAGES